MEIRKTARQPPAVVADTNAHRCSGAGGEPRTLGRVPRSRVGKTIAAIVCSAALLAATGAPVALGAMPPRGRSVARLELAPLGVKDQGAKPNSAFVDSQLAQLKQTTGVGEGIILGMENLLRAFPATVPKADNTLSHETDSSSQLAQLKLTTGVGEGIILGMENLLRAFPVKLLSS